jgi:hypothetical protein
MGHVGRSAGVSQLQGSFTAGGTQRGEREARVQLERAKQAKQRRQSRPTADDAPKKKRRIDISLQESAVRLPTDEELRARKLTDKEERKRARRAEKCVYNGCVRQRDAATRGG